MRAPICSVNARRSEAIAPNSAKGLEDRTKKTINCARKNPNAAQVVDRHRRHTILTSNANTHDRESAWRPQSTSNNSNKYASIANNRRRSHWNGRGSSAKKKVRTGKGRVWEWDINPESEGSRPRTEAREKGPRTTATPLLSPSIRHTPLGPCTVTQRAAPLKKKPKPSRKVSVPAAHSRMRGWFGGKG